MARRGLESRAQRLRQAWLRLHRWFALGLGWLLAVAGLTGAVLVVARPLDVALNPQLFRAASAAQQPQLRDGASLESIRQGLAARFAAGTDFNFRPPRADGETLWVMVRGPWRGTVYVDPATGLEQGRRGESEGLVNLLFKLHSTLLLQDTGRALLAWVSLAYLVLLLTGLALWWPRRWPPSWRIELRKGALRGMFDLHRTGGAAAGLVIAVSVATGAYMAYQPLREWVTWLSGGQSVKPPVLAKAPPAGDGAAMALDALVARAQAQFPGSPVGFVQVPARADRPVQVRLRLVDDPHPNGRTLVWLHPRSGDVLGAHRWNELDLGTRSLSVIFPLHTGELGGAWLEAVVMLGGLVLGMLGVTGLWLWWRRRKRVAAGALQLQR
jgi:uncharacterized iron-regulated membrane protein